MECRTRGRPDHAAAPAHSGIPYRGINVIMLWSAAELKGYRSPLWLTFKQALELGGNVRKGETGELVVYADRINRTETNIKGEEVECGFRRRRPPIPI
jgi:antirestriction protein ArdC